MIEPLDVVYVSKLANYQNAYHRARPSRAGIHVDTSCGRLLLMDCDELPEIHAVTTREPCKRCFIIRGRRQRILNQITVAGIEPAEADHA